MAEFQIGGVAYQSKLMDGEVQVLVLKRMLPAFTALVGCAPELSARAVTGDNPPEGEALEPGAAEAAPEAESGGGVHDMLMPVARELASLHDRDVQFIINACLDVTTRQAAGGGIGWAPVRQRGQVQDQNDAAFITRLTIAWHVLGENFGAMLASFGLDVSTLAKAAPRVP